MNEQYLWDRSGPPDPEIQQLERTLSVLRLQLRPPAPRRAAWWPAAVAASVLIAAAAWLASSQPAALPSAWQLANLQGSVSLNGHVASSASRS